MLEKFYKCLQIRAEQDDEIGLLRAQWDFDLKLYSNALQSVGRLYNHFSRHDSSHSRQILVNIGRVLGEELERLSASDIWLILETAFVHDLGMVIPYDLLHEGLKQPEFRSYLRGISEDRGHELHSSVSQLKPEEPSGWLRVSEGPLETINLFHQLVVGFYRSRHAALSGQAATAFDAGEPARRARLVPDRLFRLRDEICRLHTAPFSEILDTVCREENGMSDDICHPRFVACLLRLGDLLDLDNGRFCPVMEKIYGPAPASKWAHEDKHASIRHFICTPTSIEVVAECATDAGYAETAHWMDLLSQEVAEQNNHWGEIVPPRSSMRLPSLSRVEVRHKDNTLLEKGTLPRITINEDRALQLLQGAGLYDNKWQAIRELLQNAVDATLVRIWLEHENEIIQQQLVPGSTGLKELTKDYGITVHIDARREGEEVAGYDIRIEDQGCGISEASFRSMLSVGTSGDRQKKDIISAMPEWLKPSGAFGLGLQSVFYLGAETVTFTTRSLLDDSNATITLPSPRLSGKHYAKYSRNPYDWNCHPGTVLSFFLKEKFEELLYFRLKRSDIKKTFDPLVDKEVIQSLVVRDGIVDAAMKFRKYAFIPVRIFCDKKEIEIESRNDEFEGEGWHTFFVPSENVLLHIRFIYHDRGQIQLLYRGQYVSTKDLYPFGKDFIFVHGIADILSSQADSILKIDRNSFLNDVEVCFHIRRAIQFCISKLYDTLNEEEKCLASAFLKKIENDNFPVPSPQRWKDLPLFEDFTIDNLLHFEDDFYIVVLNSSKRNDDCSIETIENINGKEYHMLFMNYNSEKFVEFIEDRLVENGWYQILVKTQDGESSRHLFSRTDKVPFSFAVFKNALPSQYQPFKLRASIPCWGKYRRLEFMDTFAKPVWCDQLFRYVYGPKMLMPYKFISGEQQKIIEENIDLISGWCFEHQREPGKVSLEEIRALYAELREELSAMMLKDEDLAKLLVRSGD